MSKIIRLRHLSSYLQVMIADIAEKGGFSAVAQDPVEAAAKAILSGAGNVVKVLWADLKTLAGLSANATATAVKPALKQAASDSVVALLDRIFGK